MFTRVIHRKRPRSSALLLMGGAAAAAGLFTAAVFATIPPPPADSGCASIEVVDKNSNNATCTTADGAKVTYIPEAGTGSSSGTGLFAPFARLQASGSEAGFNTDAPVTLDTKTGTWTHSIKVSSIPVVTIGGVRYWELVVDINDSNSKPTISLNKVEVYFTTNASLTGYPGSFPAAVYAFDGAIRIKDVNQGSGRADMTYLIPLTNIPIPAGCGPGNPACTTYFVLYSQWGLTSGYTTDGGFDEWKVRVTKFPATTLTTVSQLPANPVVPGTAVTIVVRETNVGNDPLTNVNVTGTGCTPYTPANVASLAPGAFVDFTCTFSPTADTAWTATGHGTDSGGNPVPADGEFTSGNVDVNDTTEVTSAQKWLPNDSATITSAGGTALNGTLSFTLFESSDCTGTILYQEDTDAVTAGVQPFTLTNAASPATRSTTNSSVLVTSTKTVSWLATFTSSDPAVQNDSHCESTALTITN